MGAQIFVNRLEDIEVEQAASKGQSPSAGGIQRAIRSIHMVAELGNAEAKQAYSVQLEGVVTYSDPEWGLLFMQDANGPIYIDVHGMGVSIPAGTRIRVDAVTGPGDFGPVLVRPRIRTLGSGALPPPREHSLAELDSVGLGSQWVQTRGVLRPGNAQAGRTSFRIFDGKVWALIAIPKPDSPAAQRLVGALVRVRGVCGDNLSPSRQRLGAQIFVNRLEDIEVEEPALENPFASPTQPVAGLLGGGPEELFVRRAHIRGPVTWQVPGRFLVADRTGATFVAAEAAPVAIGGIVDVVGFPGAEYYGLTLSDALVRVADAPPQARRAPPLVPASELLKSFPDGKVVRLQARLIDQLTDPNEYVFLLSDGSRHFRAALPRTGSDSGVASLPHDAILELTGVLIPRRGRAPAGSPFFLVAANSDIVVREGTGWLTVRKALGIGGGLSVLVVATLFWVTLLRRTVRRQTGTIRAKLERELSLETEYRRLFERNLAGVFRWRPDGAIVDCNMAFAKMLRFGSREELIGRSYWEFDMHPDGREQLRQALADEALSNREACLRRRDGETVFLLESITPVESGEGTVYETTAIDVTQVRRREEELQRAKEAAEDASRCKSEFLANMSHEIRTPINGIVGMLELVLPTCSQCPAVEQRSYVAAARSSADVLMAVIDDILDFSKIEAGKLQLESVAFNLRERVGASIRMLSVLARTKHLELAGEFEPGVPEYILGDPIRLAQVINNLVGNAIKFTERGGIVVKVGAVALKDGRAAVSLAVCDTGVGIPPEKQAMIFESFSQADTSTTRRFGGTGLGLAISARLVQLMGGELGVESQPGVGSTFSFTAWFQLPAAATECVPQGGQPVRDPRRQSVPPGPGAPAMQVLAAEDNPVNQVVIQRLLERLGCSVTVVENGRQAVETWKRGRYDVIFMDVQMPEMDGYEAARQIRLAESEAVGERPPMHIVAVTAHALPAERAKCLQAGMDTHVPKPLTLASLAAALEGCRAADVPAEPPKEPSPVS
jgi:PAS domain S-box-containing protein